MTQNFNQPGKYDAVLGGQAPPPLDSLVLGGIKGIKHRLTSTQIEARIAALTDAVKYDEAGLSLVIQSLKDESREVQSVAYKLLCKIQSSCYVKFNTKSAEEALTEYSPYHYNFLDCQYTLNGHTSSIYGVACSPDGQLIASASHDKTIKIWNSKTGQLVYTFDDKDLYGYALAFSPDSNTLYCSCGKQIIIFDLPSRKKISSLKGHYDVITSLVVAPDGTLISGCQDKNINIWEQPTSGKYYNLGGHPCHVWGMNPVYVALSADGDILISGSSAGGIIKIWDWKQRTQTGVLGKETLDTSRVAISRDGMIAVGAGENQIYAWNLQTREEIYSLTLNEENRIWSISISQDSKALFASFQNGDVKIWNLFTGEEINTLKGHLAATTCIAVNPDGKSIISCSGDKSIKIWSIPE